jgi:Domain of unknown function (DUF4286)
MIVYNISIQIDPLIENEWVQWQKQEHIPEIMSSAQFTDYKFYRLLEQDETESIFYVMQFFAASESHYKKYIQEYAGNLRQKTFDRWGDKFIAFRTVMEVVH